MFDFAYKHGFHIKLDKSSQSMSVRALNKSQQKLRAHDLRQRQATSQRQPIRQGQRRPEGVLPPDPPRRPQPPSTPPPPHVCPPPGPTPTASTTSPPASPSGAPAAPTTDLQFPPAHQRSPRRNLPVHAGSSNSRSKQRSSNFISNAWHRGRHPLRWRRFRHAGTTMEMISSPPHTPHTKMYITNTCTCI